MKLNITHQFVIAVGIILSLATFNYYIKNFNAGRPFILAGHSQGSNVLINLMTGYLKDHPEVY